jgi:hypothetical protein
MPMKLTSNQVATIRSLYANGGTSQHKLARQFGISQTTVQEIVAGRRYPEPCKTLDQAQDVLPRASARH